jgi:hypothetical protein
VAVSGWHDFYILAGTASATLVGLLFVGLFRADRFGPDEPRHRDAKPGNGISKWGTDPPNAAARSRPPHAAFRIELRQLYIAVIIAGGLLFSSLTPAFAWLMVAIIVLLIVSLRNTWDLLVTVGDITR